MGTRTVWMTLWGIIAQPITAHAMPIGGHPEAHPTPRGYPARRLYFDLPRQH